LQGGRQAAQRFHWQRFNLRKLYEPEVREFEIEITNGFAALENVYEDINRTWENIKENILNSVQESLGLDKFKQNKPWFDECLGFLDQRKWAKMQWIQDPSQINVHSEQCKA